MLAGWLAGYSREVSPTFPPLESRKPHHEFEVVSRPPPPCCSNFAPQPKTPKKIKIKIAKATTSSSSYWKKFKTLILLTNNSNNFPTHNTQSLSLHLLLLLLFLLLYIHHPNKPKKKKKKKTEIVIEFFVGTQNATSFWHINISQKRTTLGKAYGIKVGCYCKHLQEHIKKAKNIF